jgi:hypothetical protein
MTIEAVFITKVTNSGTEEGNVAQKVEMLFKTVKIEYKPLDKTGPGSAVKTFSWDLFGHRVALVLT